MKSTIIFFLLSFTSVFAQVDCSEQNKNFTGKCEAYNPYSGTRSTYSYKKGSLHGKFYTAFENGQQLSIGSYKNGLLNGKFSAFYSTGEKMTEGKFKSGTGSFTLFHSNGVVKVLGQFESGNAIGHWQFFNADEELSREMEMDDARVGMYAFLINEEPIKNELPINSFFDSFDYSRFSFSFGDDSDSTFARIQDQMNESMERMQVQMEQLMRGFSDSSIIQNFNFDTTFSFNEFDNFFEFKSFGDSSFSKSFHFDTVIGELPQRSNPFFSAPDTDLVDFPDTEPSFIGGEEAMGIFIQSEMKSDIDWNKNGIVFVEVIVEKDGTISNSRIALGLSDLQDKEAIRIVAEMPNWKPAMDEGQIVRGRCVISVKFD